MKFDEKIREKLSRMRDEIPGDGPITDYLRVLRAQGDESASSAEELTKIIVRLFQSSDGIKFLILLEKAVLLSGPPNGCSDSALREANAVRNFVTDLRRIVAHG